MRNVIALFGPAGSGKDTILQIALEKIPNLHKPVFYTTRPPREGEIDGVDYHFISTEDFEKKILNNELIEAMVFNGWGYGSDINSYVEDKVNIVAIDNQRAEALLKCPELQVFPYMVRARAKTRLIRQLKREEDPNVEEIIRRYQSDKEDYIFIPFSYRTLYNEDRNQLKNSIEVLRTKVKSL